MKQALNRPTPAEVQEAMKKLLQEQLERVENPLPQILDQMVQEDAARQSRTKIERDLHA
jgi:hypothetical protein